MDVVFTLSKLLFDHDQLVVNGLGVFTTETKSAFIHPVEHSFTPEFKIIKFRADLKTKNDLLAKSIGGDHAERLIEEFVQDVKAKLKEGNKVQLKNIGFLFLHRTGEIILEQDLGFNYVKKNFGLHGFIQEPVKKIVPSEEPPKVEVVPEKKKNYKFIVYALWLVAIILAVVAVVKYDNIINYFNERPVSQVIPTTIEEETVVENTKVVTVESVPVDSQMVEVDTIQNQDVVDTVVYDEAIVEEHVVTDVQEVENTAIAVSDTHDIKDLRGTVYYVIAGCFESQTKANELLEDLRAKGFDQSAIYGKIGRLHRVCYTLFATRAEASNYMLKLKREGYRGVWLQKAHRR